MNKFKILLFILISSTIVYMLYLFFFPKSKIFRETNSYLVKNEKELLINCKVFKDDNGMVIVLFENNKTYKRIHVNFKEKLVGFPENGFGNYKIKGNTLLLFSGNIFHNNGSHFKPFIKAIDQVNFEFYKDKMKIDSISFLSLYGKTLTIEHK